MPWVPVINTSPAVQQAIASQTQPQALPPSVGDPRSLPAVDAEKQFSHAAKNSALAGGALAATGTLGLVLSGMGKLPAWAKWGAGGLVISSLAMFYNAYNQARTVGKTGVEQVKNWIKVPFMNPQAQQPLAESHGGTVLGRLDYTSRMATEKFHLYSKMGKSLFDNIKSPF